MKILKNGIVIVVFLLISMYTIVSYAGAVGPLDRPNSSFQGTSQNPYAPGQQQQQQQQQQQTTTGTDKKKPTTQTGGGSVGGSLVDPIEDPGAYEPSANPVSNNTKFIERGNLVIGVIQLLGTAISVITLMTLGIRYMLGGIQEKALYKETMGPYLIGAVMVFAIPNIIAILYDFITGNMNVI